MRNLCQSIKSPEIKKKKTNTGIPQGKAAEYLPETIMKDFIA